MAQKPDGKPANQRVTFTKASADRIASAVREIEAGNRDAGPIEWGPRGVGSPGVSVKLAAFTGTSLWVYMDTRHITFMEKDTAASITSKLPLRLSTSTATAIASMFSIPGVTSSVSNATALVTVSKMNGMWHVTSST